MWQRYAILRAAKKAQQCGWRYICGDVIMHKLRKDGAVKAAWINTMLKGRKQLIQESLHTFVTTPVVGSLINASPVFNKITPSPVS